MRTLVGLMVVLAGLVAGCGPKADPQAAQIAKLEKQLVDVRTEFMELRKQHDELVGVVDRMNQVNGKSIQDLMQLTLEQKEHWDSLDELLHQWQALATNRTARTKAPEYSPLAVSAAQPVAGATRDGVPIAIYNQIAAAAIKEWPGDYQMQAYTIKNQVEAYKKLHP